MIYWHTYSWQPKFQMWHDLFKNIYTSRRMARDYMNHKKPKLKEQYDHLSFVRAEAARSMLLVFLLQYANAAPDTKLPHVELRDAEALADSGVHATLPEGLKGANNDTVDPTHHVLTKLGEIMTARNCEPKFPTLVPPRYGPA